MALLTTDEQNWLYANHPGLTLFQQPDRTVILGRLRFNRMYEEEQTINDVYKIRLEIPYDSSRKPRLLETGGRLKEVFDNRLEFTKLADIHANEDWSMCLAAPQQWALKYLPNPDIRILFRDYIEPYFYSQSFYQQHGKWPWPHLPHGLRGIVLWFVGNYDTPGAAAETAREVHRLAKKDHPPAIRMVARAMRLNSFTPRERCLCGKKRSYLQCHPRLPKLALAIRQLGDGYYVVQ